MAATPRAGNRRSGRWAAAATLALCARGRRSRRPRTSRPASSSTPRSRRTREERGYVLDTGRRRPGAGVAGGARRESIEVQYFIWSTDNIGILAAEALLRAAIAACACA